MHTDAGQGGGMVPGGLLPGRIQFNPPWKELLEVLGGPNQGLFGIAEEMPGAEGLRLAFERGNKGSFEELVAALGWTGRWHQWKKGLWRKGEKDEKPFENLVLQRKFTAELRDFLSGEFQNAHFVSPPKPRRKKNRIKIEARLGPYLHEDRGQIAKEVYSWLHEKNSAALTRACEMAANYQRYLVLGRDLQTPLAAIGTLPTSKINGVVMSRNNSVCEFTGRQNDFFDPQTQSILRVLHSERDARENPVTRTWLPCFDFEIPAHPRGPAILNQKLALYGAIPPFEVHLTPLDFAVVGLTFDRSDSIKVASEIVGNADAFSSHTIWARRGQGKSIALSQALLRLADTRGCWAFWSFSNQRPMMQDADHRSMEHLIGLFRRSGFVPKKIIFVVDDLHLRSSSDLSAIYSLHKLGLRYGSSNGISFSFLFSATELAQSLSEIHNTIRLRLVSDDENRLYEVMTAPEPAIVGKQYESLGNLLDAHPGKKLWKDDVQSFTDFIRQHSLPLRDFQANWFTDLHQEPDIVRDVLPIVAVSQLLDLSLPDRILHSLAGIDGDAGHCKRVELGKSRRLSHDGDGGSPEDGSDSWAGYALSSSWYARSLLRNLNKLEPTFIGETLNGIVECSLDCAEKSFLLWNATESEFVRHIFQRVAKRKFGHLSDVPSTEHVAQRLFDRHGARISRLIKERKASIDCARWAGAFAYLLPTSKSGHLPIELTSLRNTIYDLCRHSIEVGDCARNPRGFVPLMWAMRALCKTEPAEASLAELTQAVESLNLYALLDGVISKREPTWERRANQIILSHVKFLASLPNLSVASASARVSRVYDEVAHRLGDRFDLDAENWLTRAGAVWIQHSRDPGTRKRAQYLARARQAVQGQRGEQSLWKARIEQEIVRFEHKFGPLSNYLEETSPAKEVK
jgi:hypothetical protein